MNELYDSPDFGNIIEPGTDYTRLHLSRSFLRPGTLISVNSDLWLDLPKCRSIGTCLLWVGKYFRGWSMVFATHHVYDDIEKGWVRQPGYVGWS